jgi:hypothetical protein
MLGKVSTGKEGSVENNNYSMLLLLSALGVSVSPVLIVLGVSTATAKLHLAFQASSVASAPSPTACCCHYRSCCIGAAAAAGVATVVATAAAVIAL